MTAKSAGTLSTANDASSGLVTSTTLKSFGGFNFGVTTGTTVTTTTSSMFTFTNKQFFSILKVIFFFEHSSYCSSFIQFSNFNWCRYVLKNQLNLFAMTCNVLFFTAPFTFEPKVTSAAPMPTFGTDSTVFTSLPSKVTWLTQIGDTFTFTTRTTPYGMPAATITTTAMAKPENSNGKKINLRYLFNDRWWSFNISVDSSLALGTSSETSADRIASTA